MIFLIAHPDEGSQLLATLVGARPGERILDACAGAGGKTLALAAQMANRGQLIAADVDPDRLRRLKPRARRAGVEIIRTAILPPDGALPFKDLFDRVLIDAPCTGSGTGRRAPDLLWRFSDERLEHFTRIQADILDRFAATVRPGGILVYGTCSLARGENATQIEAFLQRHPNFRRCAPRLTLGDELADALGATTYLELWPHRHNCDGFFGALLQKTTEMVD